MVLNKYTLRQPTSYLLKEGYQLQQPLWRLHEGFLLLQSSRDTRLWLANPPKRPQTVAQFFEKEWTGGKGGGAKRGGFHGLVTLQLLQGQAKNVANSIVADLQATVRKLFQQLDTLLSESSAKAGAKALRYALAALKQNCGKYFQLYERSSTTLNKGLSHVQTLGIKKIDELSAQQAESQIATIEKKTIQNALAVATMCGEYAWSIVKSPGYVQWCLLYKSSAMTQQVERDWHEMIGGKKQNQMQVVAKAANLQKLLQVIKAQAPNDATLKDFSAKILIIAEQIQQLTALLTRTVDENNDKSIPRYLLKQVFKQDQSGDWQTRYQELQATRKTAPEKQFQANVAAFWQDYFKEGPLADRLKDISIDRIKALLQKQMVGWGFTQEGNALIARYLKEENNALGDQNVLKLGAANPGLFVVFHNLLADKELGKDFVEKSFLLPKAGLWTQRPDIFKQYLLAQAGALRKKVPLWDEGQGKPGYAQSFYPNAADQGMFEKNKPALYGIGQVRANLKHEHGIEDEPEKKTYASAEKFLQNLQVAVFGTTDLDQTKSAQLAMALWRNSTQLQKDEQLTKALPENMPAMTPKRQKLFLDFKKQTVMTAAFVKEAVYKLLKLKTPQEKKAQQAKATTNANKK